MLFEYKFLIFLVPGNPGTDREHQCDPITPN